MNDRTTRAKIEIRLELRQLVLLSLGTMTFSGSLFAVGYWLGTRDGLQSVSSPAAHVVQVEQTQRDPARIRVKPTKAALGEVEFLFAKPAAKKKRRKQSNPVVRQAVRKPEPALAGRLPKLPARAKTVEQPRVVLPELPAVPGRLRAKAEKTRAATRDRVADKANAVKPELAIPQKKIEAPRVDSQKTTPADIVANSPAVKSAKVSTLVSAIDAELREGAQEHNGTSSTTIVAKPTKAEVKPVIAVTVPKVSSAKAKVQSKKLLKKIAPKKPAPAHYFTVQVKAVTDKGEADSFSATLRAHGLKPNVVLANIPEKGRYYRIRVGKFTSLDEARRFQKQIK